METADNSLMPPDSAIVRSASPSATDYLTKIQSVTAALSAALTAAQVTEVIIHHLIPALGADAGIVALLSADGTELVTARIVGYTEAQAARWARFPLTAPLAVAVAVQERRVLIYESLESYLAAYPAFVTLPDVPPGARAAVPLMLDDRPVGGIGLAYRETRAFSVAEATFMETTGRLCAQALERARLYEAERQTRQTAEAERERFVGLYEHMRLTHQAIGLGTWEWDIRTNAVAWSPEYCRIYGLDPQAGPPSFEAGIRAVLEEDREAVRRAAVQCLEQQTDFVTEHRIRHPARGLRWIRGLGRFLVDKTGQPERMVGIVLDVTEQHQAETALRESEERYRSLVAATSAIVWTSDAEGLFVTPQVSWEAVTGQTFEEHHGWGRMQAVHPDDRPQALRDWKRAVVERQPFETEERIWHAASRQFRWFRVRGVPVRNPDGSIREWVGTTEDIHDDKLREQSLLFLSRLDARIRPLTDPDEMLWQTVCLLGEFLYLSHCHFAEVDFERDYVVTYRGYAHATVSVDGMEAAASEFGSPEMLSALQQGRTLVVNHTAEHPLTAGRYETAFQPLQVGAFIMVPCMRGGRCVATLVADSRSPRRWGAEEVSLLETVAARTWLSVENMRLFHAAQKELEERRRAERTQQESEERYRLAIEGAELGTTHWNMRTNRVEWSETMAGIYGRSVDSVQTIEDVLACTHPEDRPELARRAQALRDGHNDEGLEYRVVRPDGGVRWVYSRGRVYRDEAGQPERFEGIVQDITPRKLAERAIEESHEQLRLITDAAPLLISYVDRAHFFRFNNRHYETWFGRPLSDIIGRSVREVLGETAYAGVRQYMEAALEGRAVTFETFMPYQKARSRYIRADFVPDLAPDGEVRGFVAVVSDHTAVKLAEQERERHLAEIATLNDGLQRAMTETHHRVKNNLQIIAGLLEVQTDARDGTLAPDSARRLTSHIRALAAVHDILTQQARRDGQAGFLTTGEVVERLMPALQTLVGARRIERDIADFPLSARQGTALALVINELVSNGLKHGRGAIRLRLRQEGSQARLEVSDEGPGFPEDFSVQHSSHIGLELIERLSRWDLNGQTGYANRTEGGAQVTIVFPCAEGTDREPESKTARTGSGARRGRRVRP